MKGGQGGETIKTMIGWCMMLLGLVVLVGAAADSKIGVWLRHPGPLAVSASLNNITRLSVSADTGLIRIAAVDRQDLAVTLNGVIWLPELFHPDAVAIDVRTAKVEVRGVSEDLLSYSGQTGLLTTDRVLTKATNLTAPWLRLP